MMAVAGLLSYLADAIADDADKGGGDDARKRMGDALRRFDTKSLEGTARETGKGAARAVDLKTLLPEREVDPQNYVDVNFGDTLQAGFILPILQKSGRGFISKLFLHRQRNLSKGSLAWQATKYWRHSLKCGAPKVMTILYFPQ